MMSELPQWLEDLPEHAVDAWKYSFNLLEQNREVAYQHMIQLENAHKQQPSLTTQEALDDARITYLYESRYSWCQYMRAPIVGEVNLERAETIIKDFADTVATEKGDITVWLHPSTWILLNSKLTLPWVGGGIYLRQNGHTVYVLADGSTEIDEIQMRHFYGPIVSEYAGPDFLSKLPGGPEMYENTRANGTPAMQSITTVVDTLGPGSLDWTESWFGPGGADYLEGKARICFRLSVTQAGLVERSTEHFKLALEENQRDDELLDHLENLVRHKTQALTAWTVWAELVERPQECWFDANRVHETLKATLGYEGVVRGANCRPEVFKQLALVCARAEDARYFIRGDDYDTFLEPVAWTAPDEISSSGWDGSPKESVYIAPKDFTDSQARAYSYARSQNMSIVDARECAGFSARTSTAKPLVTVTKPKRDGLAQGNQK